MQRKPPEIIAEAGVNHSGVLAKAHALVEAAVAAGALVVKFQTFNPGKLVRAHDPDFVPLVNLALGHGEFRFLARQCEDLQIEFLSTPGDADSLRFLIEECGVRRIKIGSDDLIYKPLLEAAAASDLPVLLSTGMATIEEVMRAASHFDVDKITLLHCVSIYPCPPEKANLRAMGALRSEAFPWGRRVGYSDHTRGIDACMAAAALGACVIEKHFRLAGDIDCPDAAVSCGPGELAALVRGVRQVHEMLGHGRKEPWPEELANAAKWRKDDEGYRPGTMAEAAA